MHLVLLRPFLGLWQGDVLRPCWNLGRSSLCMFRFFIRCRFVMEFVGGPQCIGILPILHKSRKIKTPPKLRNSETPTQKLRNQLKNSESPSFCVSEAEFPSFRGRVSESDNFGQFWRWHKKSKTLRLQWSDAFWEFSCRIFSDKIGQLRNSASKTQKHKLRNWFSEFPSRTFRVSESDFASLKHDRILRKHLYSDSPFSPNCSVISQPDYKENPEEKKGKSLENIHKIQWRRLAGIADSCLLSSWNFS